MKKTPLLTLLCVLTALLVPAAMMAQSKKVALVSFYGDKKIGGTGLGTMTEALIKDPSFNLQTTIDKAYERFVGEFAKDFPFEMMDYNEVVATPGYRDFTSSVIFDTTKGVNQAMGMQYARAKELVLGYGGATLMSEAAQDPCRMGKIITSPDGLMFVSMDYEFESRAMGFAAGVTANIVISLFDKSCNKVFRIKESAVSKSKVPAVKGIPVMDPKKIQPMCEEATEALFEDLKGRLGKIVKKSGKL